MYVGLPKTSINLTNLVAVITFAAVLGNSFFINGSTALRWALAAYSIS
jgi:hypothetical protein